MGWLHLEKEAMKKEILFYFGFYLILQLYFEIVSKKKPLSVFKIQPWQRQTRSWTKGKINTTSKYSIKRVFSCCFFQNCVFWVFLGCLMRRVGFKFYKLGSRNKIQPRNEERYCFILFYVQCTFINYACIWSLIWKGCNFIVI